MKDKRVFKVRRKDGLFATRNQGYGGIRWGKGGTIWKGVGFLKRAFKTSLKEVDWTISKVVVYELEEKAVMRRKDFK